MSNIFVEHAAEIDALLEETDVSDDVRERLEFIAEQLRLGRDLQEIIPPNIRVDEPIPGRHRLADAARAQSPTGDLPRTDITPPPPPEEQVPPHAFAKPGRAQRASVADLNPGQDADVAEGIRMEQALVAEGARRFHPPLPDVERALP